MSLASHLPTVPPAVDVGEYTDPETLSRHVSDAATDDTYDVLDHSICVPTGKPDEVYEAPVPVSEMVTPTASETYEVPVVAGDGSEPPAGSETYEAVYEVPVVRVPGIDGTDTAA